MAKRMKEIPINLGKVVLVDDADYDYLIQFRWSCFLNHGNYYVMTGSRKTCQYMTYMLMEPEKGQTIDHIDGNGLNNQRSNLRICSKHENSFNRKTNKNNVSGYKGVSWCKTHLKWRATIGCNYKTLALGYFSSAKDAAIAYNQAAQKLFGEFAKLNTIIECKP